VGPNPGGMGGVVWGMSAPIAMGVRVDVDGGYFTDGIPAGMGVD
jgi:hypothetical protein